MLSPNNAGSEAGLRYRLVQSLGNIAAVMADAEPKLKTQLYEELGLSVTYDHNKDRQRVCTERVRGAIRTIRTRRPRRPWHIECAA